MVRKNKRAKACAVSTKSRKLVQVRDHRRCVWCHRGTDQLDVAHVISRAQGGLGIPENLVLLCNDFAGRCHRRYDAGTQEQKQEMYCYFVEYLMEFYPDWSWEKLIYKKYR